MWEENTPKVSPVSIFTRLCLCCRFRLRKSVWSYANLQDPQNPIEPAYGVEIGWITISCRHRFHRRPRWLFQQGFTVLLQLGKQIRTCQQMSALLCHLSSRIYTLRRRALFCAHTALYFSCIHSQ